MAVITVANGSIGNGSTGSTNIFNNCQWNNGDTLFCLINCDVPATISSVVVGPYTFTRVTDGSTNAVGTTATNRSELWTATAISTAMTQTATITFSQSTSSEVLFFALSNCGTVNKVTTASYAAGTLTPGSITTTGNPSQILLMVSGDGSTTPSTPAGYTVIQAGIFGPNAEGISAYLQTATNGSNGTFTPGTAGSSTGIGNIIEVAFLGVVTPTSITPPTGVTATYNAGTGVTVAWTPPAGFTGTGYNVYRYSNADLNRSGVPQRHTGNPYGQIPWGTNSYVDRNCGYPAVTSGENVFTYYVTTIADNYNTVTISGSPTGGTFTLNIQIGNGTAQTTSSIVFNPTATQVKNALEALSTIGVGNLLVTGSTGGPFVISGINNLAGVPLTIGATASLTGGTSPAVTPVGTNNGFVESIPSNKPTATFLG